MKNIIRASSRLFSDIDGLLLTTTVALLFVSALNMYGIVGLDSSFFIKHLIGIAIAAILMVVFSFFNYRYLKNYSVPVLILYGLMILLLLTTLGFQSIRGARAWITIAGFTFEPSELVKLSLIIVMAKYFSQRHIHINQFRHILISGVYLAIPLLIILRQPDLGSAVILIVIWGGMLMAAGINKRHFFLLVIVGILAAYAGWIFALKPYQKDRLIAFINPYKDPTGIGYNIIQSKIAIGSGGWTGSGLGNGSQATLGFLPEAHSDFAFASLAEQFGMAGVVALFGLIIGMLSRVLSVGERATNNFGKLFCVGLAIFIGTHVLLNAAVNIGLLPITGIPFSFLSYGGSHLLSVMIGLGIVQSIKRYR